MATFWLPRFVIPWPLVVQWLRICLPTGHGFHPWSGESVLHTAGQLSWHSTTRHCMPQWRKKTYNPSFWWSFSISGLKLWRWDSIMTDFYSKTQQALLLVHVPCTLGCTRISSPVESILLHHSPSPVSTWFFKVKNSKKIWDF